MKRKILEKNKIIGLYAYLRQVELSLDRALLDSWEKLVLYFEDKVPPNKIIEYLKSIKKNRSVLIKYKKHYYLHEPEIPEICSLLKIFSIYLEDRRNPNQVDIINLRSGLNSFTSKIHSRIPKKYIFKANKIEHFNQNEYLSFYTLEQVLGKKWDI